MALVATLATLGYTDLEELGRGSYGQGTTIERYLVAIKCCTNDMARIFAAKEAAIMFAIPPHANVVRIYSCTMLADCTVMSMSYASGGDSLKMMQQRNCAPLGEIDARIMFTQLIDAIDHLHKNNFVHRDVKCENILLTGMQHRTVLLADFGFATAYQPGVKSLNDSIGSLHYSSPEVLLARNYEGPEIDIWSMGVVLYAWCSGRLPFGGATNDEIIARAVTGSFTLPSSFSEKLSDLIKAMLDVDQARRISMNGIRAHQWVKSTGTLCHAVDTDAVSTQACEGPRRCSLPETRTKPSSRLTRTLRAILHIKK